MGLTDRKRAYALARLEGLRPREAAEKAGYSGDQKSLGRTARRLNADPDVIATIERAGGLPHSQDPTKAPKQPSIKAVAKILERSHAAKQQKPEEPAAPEVWHEDPLAFLKTVMNDPGEDPKLRVDAAKALMPFVHQRKGESGKKEAAADKAKEAASKFAAPTPPKLKAV